MNLLLSLSFFRSLQRLFDALNKHKRKQNKNAVDDCDNDG